MAVNKAKILTVTSMKGGVGKTTFSMMLANIYSNLNKNVLLIDLDLYSGNLSFATGVKSKYSIYNLCEDMTNNSIDNIKKYIYRVRDNIDLITAPKDIRIASKINIDSLNKLLTIVSYMYDVVIIDTNHTLSSYNMIAYENSYKILDIITNDSYDLQTTKSFISIVKNMDVNNLVVIINNSIRLDLNFYENYDIKKIIGRNIDYSINRNLYLRNYNSLVYEEKIIDFDSNYSSKQFKYYQSLADCMINMVEGEKNDKK